VPIPNKFHEPINSLVEKLVQRDYTELERNGQAGRLGAAGLRIAVAEYGRRLTRVPPEAFELSDAVAIDSQPGSWNVNMTLWTVEEGRSDLTLTLTASDLGGRIIVVIEDLHVL
jgi:hypothetical protein